MRRVFSLISSLSLVVHSKLHSTCVDDNLILTIPYPSEITKDDVLKFSAGDCVQWGEESDGFDFNYDNDLKAANLTVPIQFCNLKKDLYETPITTRAASFYRPTANVTFGREINGQELIFRSMPIAAECGEKTTYKVQFNYNGIESTDKEECEEIDGACVFPAYDDEYVFSMSEFESDKYENVATDETRAKFAGEMVYLQISSNILTKFAVADCTIKMDEERFPLFEPASDGGSCKLDALNLNAEFKDGNFNFQHRLFLQDGIKSDKKLQN